ncbi:uncharacterized protein LOC141665588 [Apium graveolens]|uniref:uncharacterized protein LOC141665588 n=1 Tax=Apium graveolens TaxID=4045 RepID=UPI003D7972A5
MRSPRRVKDVESLTGRVAALNRFISKSSNKCQEFLKAIKEVGRNFKWTEECEEAFQNIKKYLSSPPMLSNPNEGETLILYLAVSDFAASAEVELGALVVIPRTEEVGLESQNSAPWWSLFMDGASNGDGVEAGIELISPEAHKIRRATHLAFHATNNDAEYEALINDKRERYQAKGLRTELYLKCAQRIIVRFNEVRLELIPRGQNEGADELAKLGSRRETTLLGIVPLEIQRQPSVPEHECQGYANYDNSPVASLTSLMSPWPFSMWGIDMIGELPKARGGVKYAVVAVDYFTKWAEAESLATITEKKLREFVHRAIAKLEEKKGIWQEELAQVLWSYKTTPRTTTRETLFSLVYGCEAMVPVEVGAGSFRRGNYESEANEVNHRLYMDMIEETRENAQIRVAAYQQRTTRHYNSKVRARTFKGGDLVLRRVMPNTKVVSHGVFGANWEGPYKIKSVLWERTYHLNDMQDKLIPRAWNAEHLRKYYQ